MICPKCYRETPGVNHNGRGLRCTHCFEKLPAPVPEPEQPRVAAKEEPAVVLPIAEKKRRRGKT